MNNDTKPAEGDTFECEECGMQILITVECRMRVRFAIFQLL